MSLIVCCWIQFLRVILIKINVKCFIHIPGIWTSTLIVRDVEMENENGLILHLIRFQFRGTAHSSEVKGNSCPALATEFTVFASHISPSNISSKFGFFSSVLPFSVEISE